MLELPKFQMQVLQQVTKAIKRIRRDKFGKAMLEELGLLERAAAPVAIELALDCAQLSPVSRHVRTLRTLAHARMAEFVAPRTVKLCAGAVPLAWRRFSRSRARARLCLYLQGSLPTRPEA